MGCINGMNSLQGEGKLFTNVVYLSPIGNIILSDRSMEFLSHLNVLFHIAILVSCIDLVTRDKIFSKISGHVPRITPWRHSLEYFSSLEDRSSC